MRKFMVVMDDSSEFLNALYYSALRAEKTGGGVVILSVVADQEYTHWIGGVGDAMREEAREGIEAHFEVFKTWMEGKVSIKPELIIRYGEKTEEILAAVSADAEIGVLVLGAATDRKGPGPLIENLVIGRGGEMPVPIVIVPGKMSREDIAMIA